MFEKEKISEPGKQPGQHMLSSHFGNNPKKQDIPSKNGVLAKYLDVKATIAWWQQ